MIYLKCDSMTAECQKSKIKLYLSENTGGKNRLRPWNKLLYITSKSHCTELLLTCKRQQLYVFMHCRQDQDKLHSNWASDCGRKVILITRQASLCIKKMP